MPAIAVEITRFVDEHQPGFVECSFLDASGLPHVFVEKVPIVSKENLWSTTTYPRRGAIECTLEAEYKDESGRSLARVSTELPWHVESTIGQTQFVILSSLVTSR